ncbi:MAG: FAD-dependent oxidoreductase [Candidatus Omnitrophica bacterium]|nr:FAD-dependent oxidoreductase [Candidatus Omnitrophota bacterium]
MPKTYDLIIVGAGPAGITAGIYAARKKMDCLVITEDIGGQTIWSGDVENYTGYRFMTGSELASKFEEHIKKYSIGIKEGERVNSLAKTGDIVRVVTNKDIYYSKTAIIASGKRSKELGVPGEKEFKRKGLTYCATCDGPLFLDKKAVVVGGGNSALDAAFQLTRIAEKIYIVNMTAELTGDPVMKDKVTGDEKVTIFNDSKITEVFGGKFVEGVKIKTPRSEEVLEVEGVFVEIGLVPNSGFTQGLDKNKHGEIIINCQTETNVKGVFAAGDVTNVIEKQIIVAAGEGAKASLQTFRYLARKK